MTNPLAAQFQEMLGEYEKARTSMQEIQQRMRSASATVKSDNKMMSVSVDARGEITDLTFHTRGYRTMAPAELAKVVLSTITRARAAVMAEVQELTSPFLPEGVDFDQIRQGKLNYDAILPEQPFSLEDMSPALRGALPGSLFRRADPDDETE